MSFIWKNYLEYAKHIFNDKDFPNKETIHRNVISRSYYAAHHHMRDLMPNMPTWSSDSEGDSIHKRVIKEFKSKSIGNNTLALLCDDYKKLFEWRIISDYKPNLINSNNLCDNAIRIAEDIFRLEKL